MIVEIKTRGWVCFYGNVSSVYLYPFVNRSGYEWLGFAGRCVKIVSFRDRR